MRYVLDASVALKWVLDELDSPKARQLRAEFRVQLHELLAPDIFAVEVAHALAKGERRGIIPHGQAAKLLANVISTPPQLQSHLSLLTRALDIASLARIGVYDCLYVSPAEREGCELLTADSRLVQSLQSTFPFLTLLATLP
jgi:predicted nucleic acid-binding protein